jgi:hypothetical protein
MSGANISEATVRELRDQAQLPSSCAGAPAPTPPRCWSATAPS